jgi:ATP adenylyltransferase
MDQLFTPWRFDYVTGKKGDQPCVFCGLAEADASRDATTFIVHRAKHHFLVLNIYPYTPGHLLVVPFAHEARLSGLAADALTELAHLAARVERLLVEVYHAEGINFGLNVGRSAGAGIEEHLHLHVVPRWIGDTSFITVTGNTRVLPEQLEQTWRKLRGRL